MSTIATSLSVLALKVVAKYPTKCINESRMRKGFRCLPEDRHDEVVQSIINYVTDAGRMDDDALPTMAFRSTLKDLCLKNTKLTGAYFEKVIDRCCSNLETIDVMGCFQVDDVLLKYMLEKCPKVHTLSVRNCRKLTDESLLHIINHGLGITVLHLGGNFNMTREGVERFFDTHPRLKSITGLHMSGLDLTPSILAKVGKKCTSLTELSIAYSEVPEADIRALLEMVGSQLESLNIGWLFSIEADTHCSTDFLDFVGRVCPRLTHIDISGLKGVGSSMIENLVSTKHAMAEADRLQGGNIRAFKRIRAKFLATDAFAEDMQATFPKLVYEGP
jgi:hypothetical protein